MGRVYISATKGCSYEEFQNIKTRIVEVLGNLGFKTEGDDQEVFVRFEE